MNKILGLVIGIVMVGLLPVAGGVDDLVLTEVAWGRVVEMGEDVEQEVGGLEEGGLVEESVAEESVAEQVEEVHVGASCRGYRPVLLVHGLNSWPGMWNEPGMEYRELLVSWGYPEGLISQYRYTGVGPGGSYNNQGSVVEASGGMRSAVLSLIERSASCGGVEYVDIVAHSMGGLVARQYMLEWGDSSGVDRVVTVATPYGGGWALDTKKMLEGNVASTILLSAASSLIEVAPQTDFDFDQPAYDDLTPGSALLRRLIADELTGERAPYGIYGDVVLELEVALFHLQIHSARSSWGDLVVSVESATALKSAVLIGLREEVRVKAAFRFNQQLPVWPRYVFEPDDLNVLELTHNELLKTGRVKEMIRRVLLD